MSSDLDSNNNLLSNTTTSDIELNVKGRHWTKKNVVILPNDIIMIGIMYTDEPYYTHSGKQYLKWNLWENNDYKELKVNTKKGGGFSGNIIAMKEIYCKCKKYNCSQLTLVTIHAHKSILPNSVHQKSKKFYKNNNRIGLNVDYYGQWPYLTLENCRITDSPDEQLCWVILLKKDSKWINIYPIKITKNMKKIFEKNIKKMLENLHL